MAFRILFEGTVAKHVESPEENEDAYRMAHDRGRVVLSDGASESFDARNWANLIVEQFLDSEPSDEGIRSCIDAYEALHDPNTLSWSKAAAYERGSFATLVIVQDDPDSRTVSITALGDSLAVWSKGNSVLETAPYSRAEQFIEKPTLLATRQEFNTAVGPDESGPWNRREWSYDQQGTYLLLCMTDALGAWLLQNQEQGSSVSFERLSKIRDLGDFLELVESERASGAMRRDDTTLIIATLTSSI
ncbi:hypothetical protein ACIOYV_01670 [Pseudomonas sp. NPDC087342]|uniref:hypothetical protein n=1 Tax=Pseudomonas sp. NPDC087342 TaxID=3364437 RepID=UPI00380D9D53